VFVKIFNMSLTTPIYIRSCCCMFRPHMCHHQATRVVWGDHCTIHFVLCTLRHTVVVVNFLRRIFPSRRLVQCSFLMSFTFVVYVLVLPFLVFVSYTRNLCSLLEKTRDQFPCPYKTRSNLGYAPLRSHCA
jgi:hypothetical protein